MLYSLSAITSYGHANLLLEPHWQMLGALALNGMLLFGLTTAFLFAMIQEVWPIGSRARRRHPDGVAYANIAKIEEATMHIFGKLKLSALASLVVTLGTMGAGLHPACAQDAATSGGMQFFVTPYLWLSGINATTKTPLPREPEVNSDVSAIDLLSHLSGVPFMGSAEVRDGPFGLLGDVLHVPVSTTIRTHDVFLQGGKAALNTNTGTALILYRALQDLCNSPTPASAFAHGGSR